MIATEHRLRGYTVKLVVDCEYPWRARVHNKPLWLALICHPLRVRYRNGQIILMENI